MTLRGHFYHRWQVGQRQSWEQSKHSLEESGELYMSTHILGVDKLARSAHNTERHFYHRWQVGQRRSWEQAKHSLEESGKLYMSTHIMGVDQLASSAHNLERQEENMEDGPTEEL